mgnify:CR=1 FL=1
MLHPPLPRFNPSGRWAPRTSRPPQQPDASGTMSVRVKAPVYTALYSLRRPDETLSDVVLRVLLAYNGD